MMAIRFVFGVEKRTPMRRGRPVDPITLSLEERETLERWARRPKTAQALAEWARIVLACAAGAAHGAVADQLGVTRQMVGHWRHRFAQQRVDGLLDEPRPGAPRRITDAQVEQVITLTLERTLRDACGPKKLCLPSSPHRVWT